MNRQNAWDNLPLSEKAAMIRVAVQNGITNLSDIKAKYNTFAEGGPEETWTLEDEAGFNKWRSTLPENLREYNPRDYDLRGAYKAGMKPKFNEKDGKYHLDSRADTTGKILKSPTHSSFPIALWTDMAAGYYPVKVENGYVYTDTWEGNKFLGDEDIITPNSFKHGGKIYIKPSHRGKFTELKKRTGHSASWFKAHGTPAQKKMATFALNARKWKHGNGGPLLLDTNMFLEGGPEDVVKRVIQEEGYLKRPTNIGDGKMTLGSGLTASKWHKLYEQKGEWTEEDNQKAVAEELEERRKWAEKDIPNWDKLPQNSQNALLSYKYNYDFNRNNSPKLYKALAEGNYEEAAKQIDATSSNPKFKKGLQARRKREQEWFLSGFNEPETFPDIVNTINQPDNVYTPPQSVLDNIAANNGKYMITGTPPLVGTRMPTSGIADGLAMQDKMANIWEWLKRLNILNNLVP